MPRTRTATPNTAGSAIPPIFAAAAAKTGGTITPGRATTNSSVGRSLAVVPNASDIIYCQELDWSNNSAQLRPLSSKPGAYCCWCWIADNGKPGYSYIHWDGGNFVYADGHAKYKRFAALKSGDFGLNPPGDSTPTLPTGLGHSGVCGKQYSPLF